MKAIKFSKKSALCWNCANLARCDDCDKKITECGNFNPYLDTRSVALELGIGYQTLVSRDNSEFIAHYIERKAREKGFIVHIEFECDDKDKVNTNVVAYKLVDDKHIGFVKPKSKVEGTQASEEKLVNLKALACKQSNKK